MKEQLFKEAVAQQAIAALDVTDPTEKKSRTRIRQHRNKVRLKAKTTAKAKAKAAIISEARAKLAGRRVDRVIDYLGGPRVIVQEVMSPMDAHRVIAKGLPKRAVTNLLKNLTVFHEKDVLSGALGMSSRTQQRLTKAEPDEALSVEVSSRTWQFAEVLAQASEVFGNQEDAETWLETPALALEYQKPIDLLSTQPGTDLVRSLLTRIEYGVYS